MPAVDVELLLLLIKREHPNLDFKNQYAVLVNDQYYVGFKKYPNTELRDWLDERKIREIDDGETIWEEYTGFEWDHWYGCYLMNDKKIATEFKLLYG